MTSCLNVMKVNERATKQTTNWFDELFILRAIKKNCMNLEISIAFSHHGLHNKYIRRHITYYHKKNDEK